jgi:hypothetical protein
VWHRGRAKLLCFRKIKAFILVEVLIALSITAISLVPLLHLLVVSIFMVDSAGCLSKATLIGNAKLAEVVSKGYPEVGSDRDVIEDESSNVTFKLQVSISDAHAKELEDINVSGLREVSVSVTWMDGQRQKRISLSTYISIDQIVASTTLIGKNTPQQ